MIPQFIVIAMCLITLGGDIANHGKMKPAKEENAWTSLAGTLLMGLLLWWGGFWDCFRR